MKTKISIVIPTYNRPELLHNCLLSLVNQNFDKKEYEIIIVSDGPDALTKQKVSQFQKLSTASVSYYSLAYKKGPAAARNLGWQCANSTLIAFTDDDCTPHQDWLKHFWNGYNNAEEVVYTGRIIVPVPKPPTDFQLNTARLETAEFVTANCLCTCRALKKAGGFDELFKAAWREDSDLHFRFLQLNTPIYKNEKAIVVHPVREVPWGVSIGDQRKSIYNALLYKKYPKLYRQRIKAHPNWNYYAIVLLFITGVVLIIFALHRISVVAFVGWIVLTTVFIINRLKHTSRSIKHVLEMLATSFIIPFLSVFWTLYGAYKFKVLFF